MVESCALCNSEFTTTSKVKKRKLLHYTSCSAELSILTSILSKRGVRLSEIPALSGKNAFLCDTCQRNLLKYKSLEDELCDMISKLCPKIGGEFPHQTTEFTFMLFMYIRYHNTCSKTIRTKYFQCSIKCQTK